MASDAFARSVKLRVSWALGTGFRLRLISDLTFHPINKNHSRVNETNGNAND
jgi:hypothetical protein